MVLASPAFADDEAAAAVVAEAAPEAAPEAAAAAPEEAVAAAPSLEDDFISRLKAQSEANKDKYKAQAQMNDKLSKRQFLSQYDRPSYVGVHAADNQSVTMVLKAEFEQLLKDGKIVQKYESKVSKKSGELSDDFSKPIFVFTS